MRFLKAALVIQCFFLAAFVAFGQKKEPAKQTPKDLAELVKLPQGPKVDPKALLSLYDAIIDDDAYLASAFHEKKFLGMAKRLGERGTTLLTHKYEKVWGRHSGDFWEGAHTDTSVLNIVTVKIYITNIAGTQTIQKCAQDPKTGKLSIEDVTYDLAAVVTQEYHVKEGGPAMHNATSLGSRIYRHRDTCVWE